MLYFWNYRIRHFFRQLFRDRSTRIREIGPVIADWNGGLFVQINGFYRWFDLWIGFYYDRADAALYCCVLGLGIKIKTIYRERSH